MGRVPCLGFGVRTKARRCSTEVSRRASHLEQFLTRGSRSTAPDMSPVRCWTQAPALDEVRLRTRTKMDDMKVILH
jgi:hypothetical protein